MVFSSGASTMLTKSKWPSVAHCALTVAPSCSSSRLTSRMRCGLFFTVCTPSGVRVESMMYVGMGASVVDRVAIALVLPDTDARWRSSPVRCDDHHPPRSPRMKPRLTVAAAVASALAGAPAAASAAQIQVDRGCYADPSQRQDTVTLTGN